jgi:hypothetical protein
MLREIRFRSNQMISLEKPYRTRDGRLVRALQYHNAEQRAVIGGEVRKTGVRERVIIGQVKDGNDWQDLVWNEQGLEYWNDTSLDLVEYQAPEVKHPQLF